MDCTLCGLDASQGIRERNLNELTHAFCCQGCRSVWHLLSARGVLETYKDHPVYLQAVQSGLISNPALKLDLKFADEKKRLLFEVREMWCPSCAEVIEVLTKMEKGVLACHVEYATDLASVEYDPKKTSPETIFSFIQSLGYLPLTLENILSKKSEKGLSVRFFVASFCALNVMMLSYPLYATYFSFETEGWGTLLGWISLAFSLPVLLYSAKPIYKRFYSSLKTGLYGMESLVVIGISSSFVLSTYNLYQGSTEVYFDTLTVIISFVLLGKIIESKTKLSAKEAFYNLARSLPQRARREGEFISVKDIKPQDLIESIAGERIPLDGIIVKGEALVNESASSGESLPVLKTIGDLVVAGGIIETGRLIIEVEENTSTLTRMVEACMVNLEHKSQYVRALDPLVRVFVPIVLVMALLSFLLSGSFTIALSILLISCPCAIGIAAPLVESRLIEQLAESGVIIRNRGVLSILPNVSLWAFDKTGTLTEGKLQISGLEQLGPTELSNLKGLSKLSCHPISRALSLVINEPAATIEEVFEYQGEGIQGKINQKPVYLGSAKFLRNNGYVFCEPNDTHSEVWFASDLEPIRLTLIDTLREEVRVVLKELKAPWILSGDKKGKVAVLASQLEVVNWKGELSPFEKKDFINRLKAQDVVAFVGDGLNDAPALAEANVGIATQSSLGLAQAACDILLTTDKLSILPHITKLAIKGKKLIYQNMFWAFFYNIIGLGLAFMGYLSPIFAAFAMTASSLIVIINSLRLSK